MVTLHTYIYTITTTQTHNTPHTTHKHRLQYIFICWRTLTIQNTGFLYIVSIYLLGIVWLLLPSLLPSLISPLVPCPLPDVDWMWNIPPLNSFVSTLSPQLETQFWKVLETLRSRALLRLVGHWRQALRFHGHIPLPVYSLFPDYYKACHSPAAMPSLQWRTVALLKLRAK